MASPLSQQDFAALSDFRFHMRRYERFSELAVQKEGITPLQYLLLLHIKGYAGREWATVGELAERLQAKQNGVAALISRCQRLGFVERRVSQLDRRRVEIHLLFKGEAILHKLAAVHRAELRSLSGAFVVPQL